MFRFNIDRGGTFTDIYAEVPGKTGFVVRKLLSVDPANYSDAPREGIRRILEEFTGESYPRDQKIKTAAIEWIRMGTTVATNALLERKGERTALLATKGFRDLLQIGNQARPNIFELDIRMPQLLYERVIEVDERVAPNSYFPSDSQEGEVMKGVTGESVRVLKRPDLERLRPALQEVFDAGIRSVAVVFLHSYTYHQHELLVGDLCKEIGFTQVSLSCLTMPMVRVVPRGQTTCVDAYLTPLIRQYIATFASGFDDLSKVDVSFMMSDGGLCPIDQFNGFRSILSGPAGGVVGYARTTYDVNTKRPVIGFDMGGTSTDVSRFAGTYDLVFDTTIAGVTLQSPQLDINTVAAGGGSRLFFRSGLFQVGPDSVGAHPGPVCYRKGGQLAVTDANLMLGRIQPQFFPSIFGPTQDQPLDKEATRVAFEQLTDEINEWHRAHTDAASYKALTAAEVALGFIRVADEAMCRPIRNITEARGFNTASHTLACFGGAGGQHACSIAQQLGMRHVFVHRFAGILSAYGLGLSDVVIERQEPCAEVYGPAVVTALRAGRMARLIEQARAVLRARRFPDSKIDVKEYLNLRYEGTDTSMMIECPATAAAATASATAAAAADSDSGSGGDWAAAFEAEYLREYGFTIQGRPIVIDDLRIRAVGRTPDIAPLAVPPATGAPSIASSVSVYFEGGFLESPVYLLKEQGSGAAIKGPALIVDDTSTILVKPDCTAVITPEGNLHVSLGDREPPALSTKLELIALSVFSHRFMSIAEQMGRTLQRTAISVNIKERLDFSCALFGPDGGLVANAPHLPVHLGAMQEAVRWQINHLGDSWKDGQVLISNHPASGGSHLPDITVITPVYSGGKPVFYVASRGHHADVGGISPGSMPPFSRALVEEGACIQSFVLVRDGVFDEAGVTALLLAPGAVVRRPHETPCAGSRNLLDNISDLKAQVAANNKGIQLVTQLIAEFGLEVVQAYMRHVQQNAESAVREMLSAISVEHELPAIGTVVAEDFMDDGSLIRLALTIDRERGAATFDFTGTSPQVYGNHNAPRAVTMSAIIYSLRCMVRREIPLNDGCLLPISVVIPEGSLLSPSEDAAVVGGNVLTSQRVTDVILSAFRACANSQGCMNNFTFGDATLGYYETIAGGAGAGPHWHGASAVQVHMTNTRITDPEIFERRYPVLLSEFSIRRGSGGAGKYRGGDGVVREVRFLRELAVGMLSERRAFAPQGLAGGEAAARGVNLVIRADGRHINLGGRNSIWMQPGDSLRICTPGGGGFGAASAPAV